MRTSHRFGRVGHSDGVSTSRSCQGLVLLTRPRELSGIPTDVDDSHEASFRKRDFLTPNSLRTLLA